MALPENMTNIDWETVFVWEKTSNTKKSLTCELQRLHFLNSKDYKFLSTIELQKLTTCKDLQEFRDHIQNEKKILDYIFDNIAEKNWSNDIILDIFLGEDNDTLLKLIIDFIPFDYFINQWKKDDLVIWGNEIPFLRILIKKDKSRNIFYIESIVLDKLK